MTASYGAIVIGAGVNGLVGAATLGRAGLRVLLLERSEDLAGQARVLEFALGFRSAPLGVDAGWIPPIVERGLGLSGLERIEAHKPLTMRTGSGEFVAIPREPAQAADMLRRHSANDAAKWPAFTAKLHELAGFLEALYQLPAPDIDTNLSAGWPMLSLARKFRALGRADMTEFLRIVPMSVQQVAEDWFDSEAIRVAVAAAGVQDIRQGPRSGGTGFILLHNLVGAPAGCVRGRGVWTAGPAAFTSAAEHVARKHGVTVRTGAEVVRILVHDDAVTGVALRNGEEIRATRVLSVADPARTLLGMVDPIWLDPELLLALRNIRFRGCTATVMFAMDALPEVPGVPDASESLRGLLSLTTDLNGLERAADAAKYGRIPDAPHIEITAPSLNWPQLAPPDKHVILARAHYVPYRLSGGASWDATLASALADRVLATIDSALPCFSSRVLQRVVLTPQDVAERFALTEGAVTHGELGLDQILFMRPVAGLGHYETPIAGLYLGGAGTHPGPGVLGGPGWLAAHRILADRRANK